MHMPECEHCVYNMYDEEYDEYTCTANIDEDEMARLMQRAYAVCPFFRDDNEYKTAAKQ